MAFPRRFVPTVSDHAVLRWIERVHGVDLEAVREQILDQGREAWLAQGAVSVQVPELKVTLIAKDGCVVTVRPGSKGARL